MRILAIRGRNIASLAQKFELDLNSPPLDRAGLFAITGATGSGKSTLLDVLCLALFDRIPRMAGGGKGFKIALGQEDEQELSSTDVRHILRRGASEAMAEVDFLGNDRHRYRSTWRVRRARARAGKSGLLKKQELSLVDLETNAPLGGSTKTEVLELIEQRLGLDFEQFRRSVLLAQGEFAAFLKAESKHRSDLLERMTGTQIYTRISIAAYAKTKEERERLQRMNEELSALTVLDAEGLQELTTRIGEAEKQKRLLEEELASCRKTLAWLQTLDDLTRARDQAHDLWRQVEERRESLREDEEKLDAVLAVQPLRDSCGNLDRSLAVWTGLTDRRTEVNLSLERLEVELGKEAERLADAKSRETKSSADYDGAKPDLVQARDWDSVLAERQKQIDKQNLLVLDLRKNLAKNEQEIANLVKQEAEADEARLQAHSWLADHEHLEPLAGEWFHWQKEIERFRHLNAEHERLERLLDRETDKKERIASELESQTKDVERAGEVVKTKAAALSEARTQAGAFDRGALDSERDRLLETKVFLETRMSLDREQAVLEEDVAELEHERRELNRGLTEIEIRLPLLAKERETLQVRLEEAERALKLSESSLDFEEKRHEILVAGHACPLCGSKEHPYLETPGGGSPALKEQKKRVRQLREDQQKWIAEASSLNTSKTAGHKRVAEIAAQLESRRGKMAELVKKRESLNPGGAGALGIGDLRTADGADVLAETLARIKVVESERKKADQTLKEEARIQDELRTDTQVLERLRERHLELEKQVYRQKEEANNRAKDVARGGQELAASLSRFQPVFHDRLQPDLLRSDPADFLETCERWVAQWKDFRRKLLEADALLSDLARKKEALKTGLDERRQNLDHQTAELNALEQQQSQLRKKRSRLFEGKAPAAVEEAFLLQIKTAKDDVERFRLKVDTLNGQKDSLLGQRVTLEQESARAREEKEQFEQSLARSLEAVGKSEADVRALLQVEPQWIQDQQQKLREAEDHRVRCRTIHEERCKQVVEHRASMEPEPLQDETQALETRLKAAVDEIDVRLKRDQLDLMRDEEKRAQRNQKTPLLEEQERQTEWWEMLNRLIGSAEGGKFRKYAQSLTLDSLVAHANDHLRDLARRYELERVPGEDLELQVIDRDMGDDIRALNSLSGGETFLVSLALALGLSSLSSQQTQIESLFIDEGFGTLDAHTLDSALTVLDTLQAEGRQIGIISHVPAVAERIGVRVQIQKAANGSSILRVITD